MNLKEDNKRKTEKEQEEQALAELLELLEIFKELPEKHRKTLISRIKREAAGEILTEEAVEKERRKIMRLFSNVKDKRKKEMIERKVKETAFQAVAMREAKESIVTEGLQKEVVNGSQRYPKENPAVIVFDKYSRAYNSNIDKLIEYLPPEEEKKISKLEALRNA
ncbi:hypothetical protein ACEG19_03990 [Blautia stercoris]|uniref:hypothetical protein n=1 Tax=Blautia stercoris TaxID=871664 RepID=UPI00355BAB56